MATGHDNQKLPGKGFINQSSINKVISAMKKYDRLIATHCH
jgi:hypothetical protein